MKEERQVGISSIKALRSPGRPDTRQRSTQIREGHGVNQAYRRATRAHGRGPGGKPRRMGSHGVGMGPHGVSMGPHGVSMGLAWGWHGVGMGLSWGWHGGVGMDNITFHIEV
jgi:hypothetical protein